jgi:hypothetical protein
MKRVTAIFGFFLLVCFSACEQQDSGVVDSSGSAPFLSELHLSPESVSLNSLPQNNGLISVSTHVQTQVFDTQGIPDIREVRVRIIKPESDEPIVEGSLENTQTSTPGQSSTGTFEGTLSFSVSLADAGEYRVVVYAVDASDLRSNSLDTRFVLTRENVPPVLGTPGIRLVSTAGVDSTLFQLTITVADSNGYGTIREVTVRATGVRDSSSHNMFDDGLGSHGDGAAGDGTYSLRLWATPTGLLEGVVFTFIATDMDGANSVPVSRAATNRTPQFVSLDVPSTIIRPSSGSTIVNFFATVSDPDGLSDVDSVYFRNLSSSNPTNFLMYDDGDRTGHGDVVAGDGTYSRTLSIDATTSLGAKDFRFFVVDKAGARAEQARTITITTE